MEQLSDKQWCEEFYKFLVKEGVFFEFVHELQKRENNEDGTFEQFLKENIQYNFIDCAFVWDQTNKGGKFWRKLNDKWHNKIRQIKNEKD